MIWCCGRVNDAVTATKSLWWLLTIELLLYNVNCLPYSVHACVCVCVCVCVYVCVCVCVCVCVFMFMYVHMMSACGFALCVHTWWCVCTCVH